MRWPSRKRAGRNDEQREASRPPGSTTDHPRRLARRKVLKFLGVGGAAVALAPGPIAAMAIRAALRDGASPERTASDVIANGGKPSTRKRRWAMVIDLRRCDGCQSVDEPPRCTTACIEGHYLPEPMEWIEVFESGLAGGGTQFIPTPCQQCQNPPCVNVCPVGAAFTTTEGIVLTDQERCIGCRMCMAACPYDRRHFVWGDAPVPPEAEATRYSAEHANGFIRGTTVKCDFCPDTLRAGRLPYCAQACPNGAIYFGDLETDVATNGDEVQVLSKFLSENEAFNLRAELGTRPHVFYISGHGEEVGRTPTDRGRKAVVWPWLQRAKGVKVWKR